MSDQENFISRWSRRKLETGGEKTPADHPAPDAGGPEAQDGESGRTVAARATDADAAPAPEFDLDSLPSLESIGASSDMSVFMQAGVPSELRNAALRSAWVADPAIRDFVGLAENAWDFTDPNAMEGFGALDPDTDVKRMVADIFRDTDSRSADADLPSGGQPGAPTEQAEVQETDVDDSSSAPVDDFASASPEQIAAAQNTPPGPREEIIAAHPKHISMDIAQTKVGRGPDDAEAK